QRHNLAVPGIIGEVPRPCQRKADSFPRDAVPQTMVAVSPIASDRRRFLTIYRRLLRHHGPAGWWPGETAFEVCLGAILTQNTSWTNVEKALAVLRERGLLSFVPLRALTADVVAPLIRSSGYFNVKARRLASFLEFLEREYGGRVEGMATEPVAELRAKLL